MTMGYSYKFGLYVDVYKWVVGFITKRWAEKEGVVYTGLVRWWSG